MDKISLLMRQYDYLSNKALDWLILSWKKDDDIEKQICKLKYEKYCRERRKLAQEIVLITSKWI